jgi:hypothetical protein
MKKQLNLKPTGISPEGIPRTKELTKKRNFRTHKTPLSVTNIVNESGQAIFMSCIKKTQHKAF